MRLKEDWNVYRGRQKMKRNNFYYRDKPHRFVHITFKYILLGLLLSYKYMGVILWYEILL